VLFAVCGLIMRREIGKYQRFQIKKNIVGFGFETVE
jgi:hypothetical protein